MKFLLDQGLPRSTVAALAQRGLSAQHVGDLGMATATDEAILQAGHDGDAIVVTLDADFHSLLATSRASKPSVIRIRIEGLNGDEVAEIVQQAADAAKAELEAGAAVSVTPVRVRIRLLPLI